MNDIAKPAGQLSIWRFAALLLACFGVPVLLSVPPVLLRLRDAGQIFDASLYLQMQIMEVDKKIVEISDMDKTRDKLLQRKSTVDVLQTEDMRIGENLRLMGQLSPGLQLLSFSQDGESIRFTVRCDDPLALSNSIGLLSGFGWRDVHVVDRRWERDRRIERVEISARERRAWSADEADLWLLPDRAIAQPQRLAGGLP
jgi:hypothetical protein